MQDKSYGPNNQAFAKIENNKFYVTVSHTGITNGHLADPQHDLDLTKKKSGRECYSYRKVSSPCFDKYCDFLETQNQSYYREAERLFRE